MAQGRGRDDRSDEGFRAPVRHELRQSPAEVEAYWAEALPRAHAAMARAELLAPRLHGMTPAEARELVAADEGLSIRFLEPGAATTAEAVFGRINATVVDGRIHHTRVG